MMEEFPKNSRLEPSKKIQAPTDEKKRVERVTTSEAIVRKKPLTKRFVDVFFGGDARRAWGDVVLDVLVPAAKDMMADAVSQGFERMIYGEAKSRSRRPSYRSNSNQSYVSYNRYSSPSVKRDEPRQLSSRSRATHDFGEIVLPTRAEAEEVIDGLFNLISKYESASVADLYEMVGVTASYTDEKWGWIDFRGADVSRVRDGYLLNLPRPEPID